VDASPLPKWDLHSSIDFRRKMQSRALPCSGPANHVDRRVKRVRRLYPPTPGGLRHTLGVTFSHALEDQETTVKAILRLGGAALILAAGVALCALRPGAPAAGAAEELNEHFAVTNNNSGNIGMQQNTGTVLNRCRQAHAEIGLHTSDRRTEQRRYWGYTNTA
jgi:hypothetical protein